MPVIAPDVPEAVQKAFSDGLLETMPEQGELQLTLPLPVFRYRLDDADQQSPIDQILDPEPDAWRALVRRRSFPLGTAQVGRARDGSWRFQELALDRLSHAFAEIVLDQAELHERLPMPVRLRWLELPELGIDALWLHGAVDGVVPLVDRRGLVKGKVMPAPAFMAAVVAASIAWKAHQDLPQPG